MMRLASRPPSARGRWAQQPGVLADLAVVAVVAVLSVGDVAAASAEGTRGERPADWLAYALVIGGAATMFWRRRSPVVVAAIVTAVVAGFWWRGHGAFLSVLGLPALYAVAAHEDRRRWAWWSLAAAFVALMLAASFTVLDRPEGYAYLTAFSMAAFLVAAITAGVLVRNRERIFVDTERRAAAAEADRLAEAARAVARERSRIAREMHDVVAHGMSVIAVQAAAGQEIARTDPDKAADVFARIEAVGRESLTELRRMLGVLRDTADEAASLSPQPGVGDIVVAVEQSSDSGVATELIVDGRQRALAPGIELAAFRIVQEALTNVRKHAGRSASAKVHLIYGADTLVVEVTDDGRGAATSLSDTGAGNGLIGMRERVEIYGGEFHAGPRRGGGYAVRATLPVVDTAAPAVRGVP